MLPCLKFSVLVLCVRVCVRACLLQYGYVCVNACMLFMVGFDNVHPSHACPTTIPCDVSVVSYPACYPSVVTLQDSELNELRMTIEALKHHSSIHFNTDHMAAGPMRRKTSSNASTLSKPGESGKHLVHCVLSCIALKQLHRHTQGSVVHGSNRPVESQNVMSVVQLDLSASYNTG